MTTWLEKRLARRSGTEGLETERLLLNLTENFARMMVAKNIKRADLARRMGVDRAVVTRVMAGDRNVTLRTLVSIASSLGCRLMIEMEFDAATEGMANPVVDTLSEMILVRQPGGDPPQATGFVMQSAQGETVTIDRMELALTALLGAARTIVQPSSKVSGDDRGIKAAA